MDFPQFDLWQVLQKTDKTVLLYGMGNGADKVLDACAQKGIAVGDCFASDGFVRGQLFHGKRVLSYSEAKEKYGADGMLVLLSFGSSRPEVMETVANVEREVELYLPDVPAFGDGLFDLAFARAHEDELDRAYSLLSDDESRRIFRDVLWYKLTGKLSFLRDAESDPDGVMRKLICPDRLTAAADLGAYNGDTVRELLGAENSKVKRVFAVEPDTKNFQKLCAYAKEETRAEVIPLHYAAYDSEGTLLFDASGNRNSSAENNRSASLSVHQGKTREIKANTLDALLAGERVDYIKYDVEGTEEKALLGSKQTVDRYHPTLLVSLYHRNEDLFSLPLFLSKTFSAYRGYYLRRFRGYPAWDLNLYLKKE